MKPAGKIVMILVLLIAGFFAIKKFQSSSPKSGAPIQSPSDSISVTVQRKDSTLTVVDSHKVVIPPPQPVHSFEHVQPVEKHHSTPEKVHKNTPSTPHKGKDGERKNLDLNNF